MKHHTNWRLKAIENLEKENIFDLHFSSVCTISQADAVKIKNIFSEMIKKNSEIIKASAEEKMYVINIDFLICSRNLDQQGAVRASKKYEGFFKFKFLAITFKFVRTSQFF